MVKQRDSGDYIIYERDGMPFAVEARDVGDVQIRGSPAEVISGALGERDIETVTRSVQDSVNGEEKRQLSHGDESAGELWAKYMAHGCRYF